jgi:hypothetical protein
MKAIFRKIFIIFFLSIYAVTASGFHLAFHYCGGKVAFIGINGHKTADDCCGDEDIFELLNQSEQDADGCCKSKADYIKIRSEQVSPKFLEAKKIEPQPIQLYFLPVSLALQTQFTTYIKSSVDDTGPPEPNLPHYLSFNNLRI